LKALKDGLLDSRGSLANELLSCAIDQANQCQLPFAKKKDSPSFDIHIHTLVMAVTTNKTVSQRPPFTTHLKTS